MEYLGSPQIPAVLPYVNQPHDLVQDLGSSQDQTTEGDYVIPPRTYGVDLGGAVRSNALLSMSKQRKAQTICGGIHCDSVFDHLILAARVDRRNTQG